MRLCGFALLMALCLPMLAQPAPSEPKRAQGKAESALLDWVMENSGPLKGDIRAGQFRVAYTITPAEGWWQKAAGNTLEWHEPSAGGFHLRVFVAGADGRLISTLRLHATLIDGYGNLQSAPVAFGWYPLINAYGANVPLELPGELRLRVVLDTPGEGEKGTTTIDFPSLPVTAEALSHIPLATAIVPSDEAALLKPCNEALREAITALWKRSAAGEERAAGDYFIGYAMAAPPGAGSQLKRDLGLAHHDEPLTLLIRDSRSGRLIPGLVPHASLVAADGSRNEAGGFDMDWRAWLMAYRGGSHLHGARDATLRVRFDAPGFRRWGRQSERFAAPGEIEFHPAGASASSKESQ